MATYNPENQYRCTIIRGKSQTDMEDLLPYYANMISQICPCTKEEFDARANKIMANVLYKTSAFERLGSSNQKTIRNHITEIAGSLFGLYYIEHDADSSNDLVYESDACRLLLENMDSTLFFKNLCLNFQFPNGEKKLDGVYEDFRHSICLKPYCFVIAMLQEAEHQKIVLTKQEIGFYALNNLDVLQGKVSAKDVVERILLDRRKGTKRPILSGSHDWQHIKEQFNLLELTNLVEVDAKFIRLNLVEQRSIELFIRKEKEFRLPPAEVQFENAIQLRNFVSAWRRSKGLFTDALKTLSEKSSVTKHGDIPIVEGSSIKSKVDLGEAGEAIVFELEQARVRAYKPRLANKVLLLSKTKGLGYDICSIEGDENYENPEFARYIEVKSTRRVTEPRFDKSWTDTLNLTGKEWIAAQQYGEYYNIYRVYFTRHKVIIMRIKNPYKLFRNGEVDVFPLAYQMNFGASVIEQRYER